MSLIELKQILRKNADREQAKILKWFFKTAPGDYGEGDKFLGIKVPVLRKISKNFINLNLDELQLLLSSEIHEERLAALMILVLKFQKCSYDKERKHIFDFYLKNTKNINNWDLVDLSAPKIVGEYLLDKDKLILENLASSKILWEKRISILSTFQFIKANQFETSLNIAEKLLNDDHDLIHKAVGWMLREIGKRNLSVEENFLNQHYKKMPRTMLRYAIEKFPEKKRQTYLKNKI